MEKLKVVLINPPLRATSGRIPIYLLSLAGYIETKINNVEVKIVDIKEDLLYKLSPIKIEKIKEKIIEEVVRFNPKVVGFSSMFCDVEDVNDLAKRVRKILPKSIIVAGGVQASFSPEEFVNTNSSIDYVIIGEGELPFSEFLKAVQQNKAIKEIRKIKSLAWFSNGRLHETSLRKDMINLDDIPILPYHKVNMDFYLRPQFLHVYRMMISGVPVIGTRGCPGVCTFCTSKRLWERCSRRDARSQSPKKFVDEVEFLVKKYNVDGFFFLDESFTYNKKRAVEICKEIIKRKLNIVWMCQTRVGLVDEETLIWLKKAGCIVICFGVESGSQEALNRMKKGIIINQVYKSVELSKKAGLRIHACFMINTPGETEEDLKKTFDMVKNLNAQTYNFAITLPIPGSELFNQIKDKFTPDDYKLISDPSDDLFRKDNRFRLSQHNLDLPIELKKIKKFEPRIRRITTHFNLPYINKILTSKSRGRYYKEILFLLKFTFVKFLTGEKSVN